MNTKFIEHCDAFTAALRQAVRLIDNHNDAGYDRIITDEQIVPLAAVMFQTFEPKQQAGTKLLYGVLNLAANTANPILQGMRENAEREAKLGGESCVVFAVVADDIYDKA